MSYIEPKCLLKAKNWIKHVQNPSGEIWGLSFAATHSGATATCSWHHGWTMKITYSKLGPYDT